MFPALFAPALQAKDLVIAVGEFPPFCSRNLPGGGSLVRLACDVVREMGHAPVVQFHPWGRVTKMVKAGRAWATLPYAKSPQRMVEYRFSDAIHISHTVLFYYGEEHRFVRWYEFKDLRKFRIAANPGYSHIPILKQSGCTLDLSQSMLCNFNKLVAGRVDLFAANRDVGKYMIDQKFPDVASLFGSLPKPLETVTHHLVVDRKNPESCRLLKEFNQTIRRMKDNGRLKAYLNYY